MIPKAHERRGSSVRRPPVEPITVAPDQLVPEHGFPSTSAVSVVTWARRCAQDLLFHFACHARCGCRSIKVDGLSELHAEPHAILICIGLEHRGPPRALVEECISAKEARVLSDLIKGRETDGECLDVYSPASPGLPGIERLCGAVGWAEHHDQAPL